MDDQLTPKTFSRVSRVAAPLRPLGGGTGPGTCRTSFIGIDPLPFPLNFPSPSKTSVQLAEMEAASSFNNGNRGQALDSRSGRRAALAYVCKVLSSFVNEANKLLCLGQLSVEEFHKESIRFLDELTKRFDPVGDLRSLGSIEPAFLAEIRCSEEWKQFEAAQRSWVKNNDVPATKEENGSTATNRFYEIFCQNRAISTGLEAELNQRSQAPKLLVRHQDLTNSIVEADRVSPDDITVAQIHYGLLQICRSYTGGVQLDPVSFQAAGINSERLEDTLFSYTRRGDCGDIKISSLKSQEGKCNVPASQGSANGIGTVAGLSTQQSGSTRSPELESSNEALSSLELSNRALVETFLLWCRKEVPFSKVTKKRIWTAAGYKSARQFQYWQAGSHRSNVENDRAFRRILEMSPTSFVEKYPLTT